MNIEDIENQITPDEAAARSFSHEFAGEKLEPFSRTRQTAAEAMGVKIVSTNFGQHAEQLIETGSYPGFLADAIAIVWLCAHPVSAAYRAVRKPDEATTRSLQWWEEHGGDVGSEAHIALIEAFSGIIEDVFAVQADIDAPTGKGGGASGLGESSGTPPNTSPSSEAPSEETGTPSPTTSLSPWECKQGTSP
jgi:hypothetical protein